MERTPISVKHKPIIGDHKPFCRRFAFTCKSCKHKRTCLQLTRKYVCIKIPQYPIWEHIYEQIHKAKEQKRDVYVITNRTLSDEFIWDISYSSRNIIQLNVTAIKDSAEWVSPMVHLAERCGICVNLVIHSIIPVAFPTTQLFSILESVRNCVNYRLILNFSLFRIYGNPNKVDNLVIQKTQIPTNNFKFIWDKIWGCSDEYKNHIKDLVQFYLGANQVTIIICGR